MRQCIKLKYLQIYLINKQVNKLFIFKNLAKSNTAITINLTFLLKQLKFKIHSVTGMDEIK